MSGDFVNLIIKQIEKEHGKGSIFMAGEEDDGDYDAISTGSLGLDEALGNGGLVKGRIAEIFGLEAVGKTTLLLQIIKEAMIDSPEKGVAFLDVEHALDRKYAERIIGKENFGKVFLSQPDSAEQALDILTTLTRSSEFSVVVLDSVAGLVTKAELEGKVGDVHIAQVARLMSQTLKEIASTSKKSGTLVIFSNQVRDTIGYGQTTPGGHSLRFYASFRIKLRKDKVLKTSNDFEGIVVKAEVKKNKCSAPFKTATFSILFSEGISKWDDIIEFAASFGLIKQNGAWYTYNDKQLGQGRSKVRLFLKENPEIAEELEKRIKDSMLTGVMVEE